VNFSKVRKRKSISVRVVELSHRLKPGAQRFRLEVKARSVQQFVPEYIVKESDWYIMEEVEICTHVGTHVEAPYHAFKDGVQAADLDVRSLIGPATVVDFTDKKAGEAIGVNEMRNRGAHIKKGDILLVRTGLSRYYMSPTYQRPYLETAAVDWLIERGIKALGIDCSGFENRSTESHEVNHRKLLGRGIPIIEDLNNLDKLYDNRVFFFALPLRIEGLDACWIRPIAVEPLAAARNTEELFLAPGRDWIS
jgi:arylformamidase